MLQDILEEVTHRLESADLSYGHGTGNAFDEAAFIILETLCLPIDALDIHMQKKLTGEHVLAINKIIDQRITTRKPAAYLLNKAYIQGISFYVDERVIVPRSYIGELLFSDLFSGRGFSLIKDPSSIKHVLDLCTGSGCLAILAAHIFPNAEVDAVDLSKDALDVAKINVEHSNFKNRIHLYEGDLFSPLQDKKYDLILTNPPYVTSASVAAFPAEYQHEPEMAHAGGKDGMDLVHKILADASQYLTPQGGLLCEVGLGRSTIESAYPKKSFLWLDSVESEGEVFWITKGQL